MSITAEQLRSLLHYDPETGIFTRKASRTRVDLIGTAAGTILKNGYVSIHIKGRAYLAHRLAWLYVTGQWPSICIDHVNSKRSDNRWANLREANRTENAQHSISAGSHLKGVEIATDPRRRKRFAARISASGRRYSLGYFHTEQEAHEAYCAAARKLHGQFASFE